MLFRDRIMPKSKPDYFSVKGVHGSSPTASLAADLSQNFRIDNDARYVPASKPPVLLGERHSTNDSCSCGSPRFPTPRRALFTTNTIINSFDGRGKGCIRNCGWNMWD